MQISDPSSARTSVQIRAATANDAAALAAIYAPEVLNGTATFELDPPDAVEMTRRIDTAQQGGYPFLVAALPDGTIVGFAYLAAFRSRAAFLGTAENSIYVDCAAQRRGVGRQLLNALISEAKVGGRLHRIVAVIGDPDTQCASIALHRSAGFTHAGRLSECGYKHGRWLDVVLMELAL